MQTPEKGENEPYAGTDAQLKNHLVLGRERCQDSARYVLSVKLVCMPAAEHKKGTKLSLGILTKTNTIFIP